MSELLREVLTPAIEEVRARLENTSARYVPPEPGEISRTVTSSFMDTLEQILPPTPEELAKTPATLTELIPKPKDVANTLLETVGATPRSRIELLADIAAILTPPLIVTGLIILAIVLGLKP